MSSIYIDANAANAKVIDPLTNNRWEYHINGGLELPTGTRISVASSFINQKGIAGGSIEIEEDIEEELVYGYYMSDSAYSVPTTGDLMDLDDDFTDGDQHVGLDLAAPFNFVQNYLNQFINEGDTDYNGAKWAPAYARGRTENPLPLMTVVRTEYPGGTRFFKQQSANGYESTGWSYGVPLLNKSTIKISKGIYTLQRLADIITKQLNGLELPDNVAKTQLQKDKEDGTFNGVLTNRNFARQARVEHSQRGFAGIDQSFADPTTGETVNTTETFDWVGGFSVRNHYFPKGSKQQVDNIVNFESVGDSLEYSAPVNYALTTAQYDDYVSGENSQAEQDVLNYMRDNIRALTPDDNVLPTVFAVRPNFFTQSINYLTDVRDNVKLAPKYFTTGTGFNHFDDSTTRFAPSLFCWRSDVLANQLNLEVGAHSQYCHVFENNSVIPAVAITNFMGEGQGEIPNTMYFNSAAKADEGTPPPLFNYQKQADPERFASTNNFPQNAMTVGTTNFSISFDTSNSLFTLEHLHEPRRIPTHDKFGNKNDSPSMECYYVQRTVDVFQDINQVKHPDLATDYPNLFYYQQAADNNQVQDQQSVVNNNLNTIAQRISGVFMRNFALSTAKRLRTVPKPDNRIANYDDFLVWDDFFNTDAERRNAWNSTIWAKLGFTYEQICSGDSYEKIKYYNQNVETLAGFTTDAGVSSSVIPMISTMYTNEKAKEVDDMGVPEFNAGVQYFNNADMNVPNRHAEATFTTDPSDPTDAKTTQVNRVYQYQNSFYDYAVMGMVQTDGKKIQAQALPQLSKHGYFLITSNIGGMTDVVNDGDPVILLDTVPKSNLANQDFIFNRNDLVHTISNPIVINSININILNPDLSNPTLAGDSSVLLRIDYPLPRETVIRQNVLDNQAVQGIEGEIQQEEQALAKK